MYIGIVDHLHKHMVQFYMIINFDVSNTFINIIQ